MEHRIKYLTLGVLFFTIGLLLVSNYYYISFPTVLDTFTYLLSSTSEEITRNSLHYISYFLITGLSDKLLQGELILTYIGFFIFLLTSYLSIKENTEGSSLLSFIIIYGILFFGGYRYFLGGFMQIVIFIGINLTLWLQGRYKRTGDCRNLIVAYIYLVFLAHINDFGVLFLLFNIVYNAKKIYLNKFGYSLITISITVWILIYIGTNTGLINIEYPTDSKLKLIYNIIINPFIWGPGFSFFEELVVAIKSSYLGYILLILGIIGGVIGKIQLKAYIISFISFLTFFLLLLPEAPSFSRYISYFLPFLGILIISVFNRKIESQKYITLASIALLFCLSIQQEKINNYFLEWNSKQRYGLEYQIAKKYICPTYGNSLSIYGYFGPSFILGYIEGGCNKNNLIGVSKDFYNGTNPLETVINQKPGIFIDSRHIDSQFKFGDYFKTYLKDSKELTLEEINKDTFKLHSGDSKGIFNKMNIYAIRYKNKEKLSYVENTLAIGTQEIFIPENAEKFYIHIYETKESGELQFNSMITGRNTSITDNIPYKEKDWNTVIVPFDNEKNGMKIQINNSQGYIRKISYYTTSK